MRKRVRRRAGGGGQATARPHAPGPARPAATPARVAGRKPSSMARTAAPRAGAACPRPTSRPASLLGGRGVRVARRPATWRACGRTLTPTTASQRPVARRINLGPTHPLAPFVPPAPPRTPLLSPPPPATSPPIRPHSSQPGAGAAHPLAAAGVVARTALLEHPLAPVPHRAHSRSAPARAVALPLAAAALAEVDWPSLALV